MVVLLALIFFCKARVISLLYIAAGEFNEVCGHLYVCGHVYIEMYIHVCVCVRALAKADMERLNHSSSHLLRLSLMLSLELWSLALLASHFATGNPCFCLLSAGIPGHLPGFYRVLRSKLL